MAAYVFIGGEHNTIKCFYIGDKPSEKYKGIKPSMIQEIQLDCDELDYAINNLGAANVKKRVAKYYGDEACRIFFNW